MTLDSFRDSTYVEMAKSKTYGALEKTSVSIQLKWLPQAQFMGYYVAKAKGYYTEAGFTNVNIVSGGGDLSETTAVSNGSVDFGVTWVSNLIAANLNPIAIEKAEGIYMWDYDGNRYTDMSSQLVNLNVGFANKEINAAIVEQLDKYAYLGPSYGVEARAVFV